MASGKFVSYIRVSTARQGASGLGLEAQQEAVQRFLDGGSWELLGEFKEIETGKGADALAKRPQLRAALDVCRKAGATLIIAKLDRLSRSVHFVSGLMESKVRFVACDMPEANKLTIHIMAAFAEHEAKRISQRTKDALAVAKARGAVLGKSGATNLRPNLEARQQAANAFAARLKPMFDGMKLRQLTQRAMVAELNAVGVPAPKGGQWRIGQVQRVLARIAAATLTAGMLLRLLGAMQDQRSEIRRRLRWRIRKRLSARLRGFSGKHHRDTKLHPAPLRYISLL